MPPPPILGKGKKKSAQGEERKGPDIRNHNCKKGEEHRGGLILIYAGPGEGRQIFPSPGGKGEVGGKMSRIPVSSKGFEKERKKGEPYSPLL